MKKIATFIFCNISVLIQNIDPSAPNVFIKKQWHQLQQEILDQLSDSKKFTEIQILAIGELPTLEFLDCIVEAGENPDKYNRARAIFEYETELLSAIKNNESITAIWATGLDALKAGAVAENYNY